MFNKLKEIIQKIISISSSLDKFKKDTVIQSLPTLTYVNRAKKFIEKNDFVMAEKILTEALSMPQKDALVYKYLGLIYEKTAKFDAAVENYQTSAELNPNDKNIWQRLGFALVSAGKFEQAEKSFDNANKIQSGNTDTLTGWGMALMKQNKFQEAYDKFIAAVQVNKYNFSALFLASVMEIKLDMLDKAESKLAFLSNVAPNEGNVFEYARLKAMKDDIDNAIHYAYKSLKINPLMLPAYVLLGQLYTKKHDKENALKNYTKAYEKGLKSYDFYLEWGKSSLEFGMFQDAKDRILRAYDLKPDNIDIQSYLALCYTLLKEYDSAKPLIETLEKAQPENKVLKTTLGITYFNNQDFDKAINILRTNDENYLNCLYMAKSYEKTGNNTKTREYFEAAVNNNYMYLNSYIEYAKYLISQNDYAEAQRKIRKALKFDENNTDLLNLMFYTSYILVKDNFSEYNVKETLSIANRIEKVNPDLFEYPRQKEELEKLLSESETN